MRVLSFVGLLLSIFLTGGSVFAYFEWFREKLGSTGTLLTIILAAIGLFYLVFSLLTATRVFPKGGKNDWSPMPFTPGNS